MCPKKENLGVPVWLRGLRIWCFHCSSAGHFCGLGSILCAGTSTRPGRDKKKKRSSNIDLYPHKITGVSAISCQLTYHAMGLSLGKKVGKQDWSLGLICLFYIISIQIFLSFLFGHTVGTSQIFLLTLQIQKHTDKTHKYKI